MDIKVHDIVKTCTNGITYWEFTDCNGKVYRFWNCKIIHECEVK